MMITQCPERCGRVPDPPTAPFIRGVHCGRCTLAARHSVPVPPVLVPLPVVPPCVYADHEATAEERSANALSHNKRWVACEHPDKPLGAYACPCQGCGSARCPGYTADEPLAVAPRPVGLRHLIYHIYPVAGNGVWQRNVDALRLRWSLFTGRKIVGIMTGPGLDSADTVRSYLPPGCETIILANDPSRGELVTWDAAWERVRSSHPNDVFLYAHAKGVGRGAGSISALQWVDALYTLCLDHWDVVAAQLAVSPLSGPFMRTSGFGNIPASRWHYSGNFWWGRVGDVRDALVKTPIPSDPWGLEAWVGMVFAEADCGHIGPLGELRAFDLYRPETWSEQVYPAIAKWKLEQVKPRTPTLSVIVPTSGRDSLAHTLASITPQLQPGDEVLVERDNSGDWGMAARAKAMKKASGDYVLFMDDDDEYVDGAFATIRAAIQANPGRIHIFQMRRNEPWNDFVPATGQHEVAVGNVSTQCVVAPNDGRLGNWGARYEGDYDFIASTAAKHEQPPVFHDAVISIWRPVR